MPIIIGMARMKRKHRGGGGGHTSDYLLTAASNKLCTATGNRIKLVTSS